MSLELDFLHFLHSSNFLLYKLSMSDIYVLFLAFMHVELQEALDLAH